MKKSDKEYFSKHMQCVALRIKRYLQINDISEREFVNLIHLSKRDARKMIRGKVYEMPFQHLMYVCFNLNVKISDFYTDDMFEN